MAAHPRTAAAEPSLPPLRLRRPAVAAYARYPRPGARPATGPGGLLARTAGQPRSAGRARAVHRQVRRRRQRGGSPVAGRTAGGMAARGPGRIPRHLAGAGPAGIDDAGATAVAGVAGHAFGGRPAWRREGARPSAGEPGPVRQFAAAPGSRRPDSDRVGAGLAGPALPALQPGFLGRLLG